MIETLKGHISHWYFLYFDNYDIIRYVHFKCTNWYFKFKCLKYKADIFHFWYPLILTMWNYSIDVHFKCKNWYFKSKCLKHWGDLFHFWQVLHFDYVKLFNIFISSVKTGILSLNVRNIEGTYCPSSMF